VKHAYRLSAIPVLTIAAVLIVAGTAAAAPVAVAGYGSVAVSPGGTTVLHWGSYFGDNVAGDTDMITSPAAITLPAPVRQVSTSNSTQYALLTNGQVWAWGQGTNGQLGDGSDANSFTTAVQVQFPAGVSIALLPTDAQPYDSALAVDTTGQVWGWGLNRGGEFCNGTNQASDVPVAVPLPGQVTALAGADEHASYDVGGAVYSCGWNLDGATGLGTTSGQQETPAQVTGLPSGVAVDALVAAFGNTGALLANGKFYDWGYDAQGQVGNGTVNTTGYSVPQLVPLPRPVTLVAEGGSADGNGQTLVMLSSGRLYAWGDGTYGQLGTGKTTSEDSPVRFSPPAGVRYTALATGGWTSYALGAHGGVWAWGRGTAGQLGNGKTRNSVTPVKVATGAGMVSSTANDVVVAAAGGGVPYPSK
jgi:alpha-tubulin suppressor-like RCC1 family protein